MRFRNQRGKRNLHCRDPSLAYLKQVELWSHLSDLFGSFSFQKSSISQSWCAAVWIISPVTGTDPSIHYIRVATSPWSPVNTSMEHLITKATYWIILPANTEIVGHFAENAGPALPGCVASSLNACPVHFPNWSCWRLLHKHESPSFCMSLTNCQDNKKVPNSAPSPAQSWTSSGVGFGAVAWGLPSFQWNSSFHSAMTFSNSSKVLENTLSSTLLKNSSQSSVSKYRLEFL